MSSISSRAIRRGIAATNSQLHLITTQMAHLREQETLLTKQLDALQVKLSEAQQTEQLRSKSRKKAIDWDTVSFFAGCYLLVAVIGAVAAITDRSRPALETIVGTIAMFSVIPFCIFAGVAAGILIGRLLSKSPPDWAGLVGMGLGVLVMEPISAIVHRIVVATFE